MTQSPWHRVARTDAIEPGRMLAVEIDGREIVLCHSREGWHALDNICSHAYAKMSEGRLRGTRLICPLHGASFDVRNGAVLGAPATRGLASHQVRITDDGHVEVALNEPA